MIDSGDEGGAGRIGVAVLTGILTFLVLEKVLEISNPETNEELREKENKKIETKNKTCKENLVALHFI